MRPDAALVMRRPRVGRSFWQPISGDSLRLLWAGDFEVLDARVERQDGQLRGWVQGSTDVVRPVELLPRAVITGRRLKCPSGLIPSA